MSVREGEDPLPRYGLAGSFVGERTDGGENWDLCETFHRAVGASEELRVTVMRRTTAEPAGGGPRVAISAQDALEVVASALVLPNWRDGDGNVFTLAAQVANDEQAWGAREITVDGEVVAAREREYRGMWLAYYLTETLIVDVVAPAALRPDDLVLRTLDLNEVSARQYDED